MKIFIAVLLALIVAPILFFPFWIGLILMLGEILKNPGDSGAFVVLVAFITIGLIVRQHQKRKIGQ